MEKLSALKEKIVVITGAGRGIGAATAKLFAKNGAKVALLSRTQSELTKTFDFIQAQNGTAAIFETDISNEAQVKNTFQKIKNQWGNIDILVNNAGVIFPEPILSHSTQNWNQTLAVNVTGMFFCAREAFNHLHSKGGVILNVSSLSGIRGVEKFPGFAAYVTSKHAVIGLTEGLAVEGKPLGIRVNAIAPGAVNTAMLKKAAPQLKSDTNPEDIANLIFFLCSPESRAVSGSILEVFTNA